MSLFKLSENGDQLTREYCINTGTSDAESASEEIIAMSEASSMTGKTSTSLSNSSSFEGADRSSVNGLERDRVIDPLRFPLRKNGECENETILEKHLNESNTDSYLKNSPSPSSQHIYPIHTNSHIISHPSIMHTNHDIKNEPMKAYSYLRQMREDAELASKGEDSEDWSSTAVIPENHPHHTHVDIQMNHLELSLPDMHPYEAETVDFPDSPSTFRTIPLENRGTSGIVLLADNATSTEKISQGFNTAVSFSSEKNTLNKDRLQSVDVRRKLLCVTEELLHKNENDSNLNPRVDSSVPGHEAVFTSDEDRGNAHMDEFVDILTACPDNITTPVELEDSIMERLSKEPIRLDERGSEASAGFSGEESSWRAVVLSGIARRIDMKVIEPYKKVLSHGGYMPSDRHEAIIVFCACFLPNRSRKDYDYVMEHLFMYVLTTLDHLIDEDYILVYLHGATTRSNMPSFAWLKRCYQMIDRRLRKNLQGLYLVHPTFWLKTIVLMARPFVSSKFSRKLRFVTSLKELSFIIRLDEVCIPERVKQYDEIRESLITNE